MKSTFAAIVDFVALVGLACVVASGAVMRWALPAGSQGIKSLRFEIANGLKVQAQGETLFGWDRVTWSEIHFWLAVVFVGLLVIHFFLSWSRTYGRP